VVVSKSKHRGGCEKVSIVVVVRLSIVLVVRE